MPLLWLSWTPWTLENHLSTLAGGMWSIPRPVASPEDFFFFFFYLFSGYFPCFGSFLIRMRSSELSQRLKGTSLQISGTPYIDFSSLVLCSTKYLPWSNLAALSPLSPIFNLYLLNLARMLGSIWILLLVLHPGSCLQAVVNSCNHRAYLVGFLYLRNHRSVLLAVQCLKNIVINILKWIMDILSKYFCLVLFSSCLRQEDKSVPYCSIWLDEVL